MNINDNTNNIDNFIEKRDYNKLLEELEKNVLSQDHCNRTKFLFKYSGR